MRQRAEGWLRAVGIFDQLLIAALLTWLWTSVTTEGHTGLYLALLLTPFWGYLHRYFGLYDSHRLGGWRTVFSAILTASTIGFLAGAAVIAATRLWPLITTLADFVALWITLSLLWRGVAYNILYALRRRGADQRRVLIIGTWEKAVELAHQFRDRPEWGFQVSVVGMGPPEARKFLHFPPGAAYVEAPVPRERDSLGSDLEKILQDTVVDEILIAVHSRDLGAEQEAVRLSRAYGVLCRVALGADADDLVPTDVGFIPGHLALTVHDSCGNADKLEVKRALDIVLSSVLLVLLSPLFVLLAILVKLSSPGPVLFKQTRMGLRGRQFVMIKFRTMVEGADSMLHLVAHRNITGGPIFKAPGDLRVTSIGKILRRLSLDELPQLFNVLRGDMSLVGPRPLPLHESMAIAGEFRRRFAMKPGLTCRWQVQGRNDIPFAQWMQLDVDYVDNWTLTEDLKLLLRTVPAVFSGKGAY